MKTDDLQLPATYNIFNRLVKMTVDNHVVPDLATDWEFSEDGMELTFNLRENVKWHDGEPFTSNDVVWTFTKVLEEGYQSNKMCIRDRRQCTLYYEGQKGPCLPACQPGN